MALSRPRPFPEGKELESKQMTSEISNDYEEQWK